MIQCEWCTLIWENSKPPGITSKKKKEEEKNSLETPQISKNSITTPFLKEQHMEVERWIAAHVCDTHAGAVFRQAAYVSDSQSSCLQLTWQRPDHLHTHLMMIKGACACVQYTTRHSWKSYLLKGNRKTGIFDLNWGEKMLESAADIEAAAVS